MVVVFALTVVILDRCDTAFAALFAAGDILVADNQLEAIFRIDPFSGSHSILYDDSIGTGPEFSNPLDVLVDQQHNVFVIDNFGGLFQVDPDTGDRSLLVAATSGFSPNSAAFDGNGGIIIADLANDAVHRFDFDSGILAPLSDQSHGMGVVLDRPSGVAVEADGSVIVVVEGLRPAILRVDIDTGARSVASSNFGSGPDFDHPAGIAVVPLLVPEPSAAALVGIGAVLFIASLLRIRVQ